MAFFEPPTDNFVAFEGSPIFERIPANPRGKNIYKLTDGTFVEYQPPEEETIDTVYYGGHRTEITAAEASALTAAGYGAYIT
jgi:hypothetical protein